MSLSGRIDLHLHLDGSLSLDTVRRLASFQGLTLPEDSNLLAMLQVRDGCKDLNEYLTCFDFPLSLLQTGQAIEFSVRSLLRELASQGLIYAEIRFAPQLHTRQGLSQAEVVEAALSGLSDSPLPASLILCCMRGTENRMENLDTLLLAARHRLPIDLAGAEGLYPTEDFWYLFDLARRLDVPFTIHAGEAAGPDSVRQALGFGAVRIGHGVRSVEDPSLLALLAERGTVLELCPTSNLQTGIYPDIGQYPLRRLMEAGVKVTLNTDNMTVSHTTLAHEFSLFPLTAQEKRQLQLNAVSAAFAEASLKSRLKSMIQEAYIQNED